MKIPDKWKTSPHKLPSLNTLSLTGLSMLWAVMLGYISPWWLIASIFCLMSSYGQEISIRNNSTNINL